MLPQSTTGLLIFETGLRPGEVLALRFEDIVIGENSEECLWQE